MSDPYKKLNPGDKFSPNAKLHNATIDLVRERELDGGAGASDTLGRKRIAIENTSGVALDQFGIVGLGDPIIAPVDNENTFLHRVTFESAAPAADSPFAILQVPTPIGGIASEAIISGETWVRVSLSLTTHTYAAPGAANYTNLVSQSAAGPAKILWAGTPAATQLNGGINNSVTSLIVDTSTGWPDPAELGSFVITIDTEDLLVTAISGTTWTVTRGYNSTTAASHADNAAVAFKSGTVWAVVYVDLNFLEWSTTASGILTDDAGDQVGAGRKWTDGGLWGAMDSSDPDGAGASISKTGVVISVNGPKTGGLFRREWTVSGASGANIRQQMLSAGDGALVGPAYLLLSSLDVTSTEVNVSYAVLGADTGVHLGQWGDYAGLDVSGGLITGGAISIGASDITSGTFATGVNVNGGTW